MKAITLTLAFAAALMLAPGATFAQETQTDQQKKDEQAAAAKERQKAKAQREAGEQGLKGVQAPQTQQAKPQQIPPPPQPQPPSQKPKAQKPQPQQPQWQQQQQQQQQQRREEPQQQPKIRERQTARTLPELQGEPRHLTEQQRRQLVTQQKQRSTQYERQFPTQRQTFERRFSNFPRQQRPAQYRFQQQYLDHLRQQELRLRQQRDFNRDPFFFTAPGYRYSRGGRYYDVNEYAAQLLQDAVNYGYDEGFRAGDADRLDRWRFDYESSYAYQDANYGYEGLYVGQDEYNYYFRQGFRRGYEDGYYARHRYGVIAEGGTFRVMTDVLRLIIDLRVLR